MFKRIVLWMFFAALTTFASLSPAYAQSRYIVWDRWDVVIDNVDPSANLFDVTEIYDIQFFGTFRFGQAVIPTDRLDEIRNISVQQNGQPMTQSCAGGSGTFCVTLAQEGISITYIFFAPVTDETVNIQLKYTVEGAIRVYADGDQLWWIGVTEDKYGYPVNRSTITVELPEGAAPRPGVDPVVTYGVNADVNVEGSLVTAVAQRQIQGDESFEIRVQFPHQPNATAPAWQSDFDAQRNFDENVRPWVTIGSILIGIVLAILGPVAAYYLWSSRGKDPIVGPVPEYISEPPSDLPPAAVGTLIDENAELRDIVSTIVYLADKGYIKITETVGKDFTFALTTKPLSDLKRFERRFIEVFFKGKAEVSLTSLKNKFYMQIPVLQQELYEEMVEYGFFDKSPSSVRTRWAFGGFALMFVAVVLIFVLADFAETVSAALLCIPAAMVLTAGAFFAISPAMPRKTVLGAQEAAKWKAFREYMNNLQKYANVDEASQNFAHYLPYAIAFGFERTWIWRFSKIDTVPAPDWYFPYPRSRRWWSPIGGSGQSAGLPRAGDVIPGEISRAGGGDALSDMASGMTEGLNSISDGLTQMLNSASSTFNSRPQASSSGSGSWGGGGGGWSGGGFSGGGGSGGGSRGFG